MQKFLIVAGAVMLVAGLAWPLVSKFGLGRLPGDIIIRRDGLTVYLPFMTMLIVSVVLTLIFRFFGK